MRKRLSYANVAATMALVFSMTGGALAAKHYLINSTSQINPKVLKKLTGARGAQGPGGAQGPAGAPGAAGLRGEAGPPGPVGGVLGVGQSESGTWAVSGESSPAFTAINFVHPIAKGFVAHLIAPEQIPPSGCSGTPAEPKASPGNLCVFASAFVNAKFGGIFDPGNEEESDGPLGAIIFVKQNTLEQHFDGVGTWVVTG